MNEKCIPFGSIVRVGQERWRIASEGPDATGCYVLTRKREEGPATSVMVCNEKDFDLGSLDDQGHHSGLNGPSTEEVMEAIIACAENTSHLCSNSVIVDFSDLRKRISDLFKKSN